MSDDGGGFRARAARYVKVSTRVGGLAAKLAGERYLGLNLDRQKHAEDLRAAHEGFFPKLMGADAVLA